MNCESFKLKAIDMEKLHQRSVLRCLLHTILFNRMRLDAVVVPVEMECDVLDPPISYVQIDYLEVKQNNVNKEERTSSSSSSSSNVKRINYQSIAQFINQRIEAFCTTLQQTNQKEGSICLSFYTVKKTRGVFSFFDTEEKVDLERWLIPIKLINQPKPNEITRVRNKIRSSVVEGIFQIIQYVNNKQHHLPSIKQEGISHFSLSFVSGADSHHHNGNNNQDWTSGISLFKEMLQDGPPMLLGLKR